MIDTILLNVIKMLTERKILLEKNEDKHYKNILGQKTDEKIFTINADTINKKYHISLIYSSVSNNAL